MEIHANTGRDAVLDACRLILTHGRHAGPRGQTTLELMPVTIVLEDTADTIPDGIGREKLTPAIAAVEALQNVAGFAAPEIMSEITSFFPKPTGKYADHVETYGPRMRDQLPDVVDLLRRDLETREAVVAVWRPGDVTGGQAHNLCTTTVQFLCRGGRLDLHVNMRSNDAWWGLCYDLFQFAQVQQTVARCLGVPAGRYFHNAASMHLYERHWEAASKLHPAERGHEGQRVEGLGIHDGQSWHVAVTRATLLLKGQPMIGTSPSERWFQGQLGAYVQ